jgi:hypothetical protein
MLWNYSWPIIDQYHKNGEKIDEETLEDMYLDPTLCDNLVHDLEINLKRRLAEMVTIELTTL